jgi:hypothetical protein
MSHQIFGTSSVEGSNMLWLVCDENRARMVSAAYNRVFGSMQFLRNCHTPNQEISPLLQMAKVHYRAHQGPIVGPILSH